MIPRVRATPEESKGRRCVHTCACVLVCVCMWGGGMGRRGGAPCAWVSCFLSPRGPRRGADAPSREGLLGRRRGHSHLQIQGFLIPEISAPRTPLRVGVRPGPHRQVVREASVPEGVGLGGLLPAAAWRRHGLEPCMKLSFLLFKVVLRGIPM